MPAPVTRWTASRCRVRTAGSAVLTCTMTPASAGPAAAAAVRACSTATAVVRAETPTTSGVPGACFATVSTTLRLHMWFASQVHPETLPPLRARVLRWVVVCEALLLIVLLGLGIAISGRADGTAAHLVVTALLLLLSLMVIEPATTRASRVDGVQ